MLFSQFEEQLKDAGFAAKKGQIVDASIVNVPRQGNKREENQAIKEGKGGAEDWDENKRRQKDVEARWTKKNNKTYYGYKNHIEVDNKHKLIRKFAVTDASLHDSQVFEELLDESNTSRDVWADSAYPSQERLAKMKEKNWRPHLQGKGDRSGPLDKRGIKGNKTRSRTRSRVEHIFGAMAKKMGDKLLRGIGIARATLKIGMRNLAYNMDRLRILTAQAS